MANVVLRPPKALGRVPLVDDEPLQRSEFLLGGALHAPRLSQQLDETGCAALIGLQPLDLVRRLGLLDEEVLGRPDDQLGRIAVEHSADPIFQAFADEAVKDHRPPDQRAIGRGPGEVVQHPLTAHARDYPRRTHRQVLVRSEHREVVALGEIGHGQSGPSQPFEEEPSQTSVAAIGRTPNEVGEFVGGHDGEKGGQNLQVQALALERKDEMVGPGIAGV